MKGRSVADCGDDRGRNQGAYAGDLPESLAGWIGRGDLFNLFVHRDDLLLQVLPLAPQQADEVTHAWCEVHPEAAHHFYRQDADFLDRDGGVFRDALPWTCAART